MGEPNYALTAWTGQAGLSLGDVFAITEDRARQIADAFGLFGSPERCADQLLRARDEAGPILVWTMVALTVYSGLGYTWRHREVIAPDQ